MTDIEILQSLPSLYPLKDYEEEAVLNICKTGYWIPCSERLPEKNGEYLITGRQGAVNKRRYHDGHWYGNWSVLAWMPLPKPYNIESEKNSCVDVKTPVKRGKWVYLDYDNYNYDSYKCSNCKREITVDAEKKSDIGFAIEDMRYCPYCGSYNASDTNISSKGE